MVETPNFYSLVSYGAPLVGMRHFRCLYPMYLSLPGIVYRNTLLRVGYPITYVCFAHCSTLASCI